MNEWFRLKAKEKLEESLERKYPIIEKYGIQKPQLSTMGIVFVSKKYNSTKL